MKHTKTNLKNKNIIHVTFKKKIIYFHPYIINKDVFHARISTIIKRFRKWFSIEKTDRSEEKPFPGEVEKCEFGGHHFSCIFRNIHRFECRALSRTEVTRIFRRFSASENERKWTGKTGNRSILYSAKLSYRVFMRSLGKHPSGLHILI